MQSLVALRAVDACMNAVSPSDPKLTQGAVRVLQHFHEVPVVDGLLKKVDALQDPAMRSIVYGGLCRLYHEEAPWDGNWWGTRPDMRGPYYKPIDWDGTTRIAAALANAFNREKGDAIRSLVYEVQRNGVDSADISSSVAKAASNDPAIRDIVVDTLDNRRILTDDQVSLLQRVADSDQEAPATRVKAIRALKYGQGSRGASEAIVEALSTVLSSQHPDPHLRGELDEFIRETEHAQKIRTFEKLASSDLPAKSELGYAVLTDLANSRLIKPEQRESAQKGGRKRMGKPSINGSAAACHRADQDSAVCEQSGRTDQRFEP